MTERDLVPPESPTAIGMQTGMPAPGLDDVRGYLDDVRGPLEEALVTPPPVQAADELDVVPGQSGAEGLAELPHSGTDDPWDGP